MQQIINEMSENVVRVAVASREGFAISEHFGHAKSFYIYNVTPSYCEYIVKREVDHYCLGGHSDQTALSGIFEAIKDCSAVFVVKIGDGPSEKLEARGITAVSDYAWLEIDTSLREYAKQLNVVDSI